MYGKLVNQQGQTMKLLGGPYTANLYVNSTTVSATDAIKRSKYDIFTVSEMLQSAGIPSLDEPADNVDAKGAAYRYEGISLEARISYSNTQSAPLSTQASLTTSNFGTVGFFNNWGIADYATYTVKFVQIKRSESKVITPVWITYPDSMWLHTRNGMTVRVAQAGSIARFQWQYMILVFLNGAVYWTVAVFILDLLAVLVFKINLKIAAIREKKKTDKGNDPAEKDTRTEGDNQQDNVAATTATSGSRSSDSDEEKQNASSAVPATTTSVPVSPSAEELLPKHDLELKDVVAPSHLTQ